MGRRPRLKRLLSRKRLAEAITRAREPDKYQIDWYGLASTGWHGTFRQRHPKLGLARTGDKLESSCSG
jgi:hypothetical protein